MGGAENCPEGGTHCCDEPSDVACGGGTCPMTADGRETNPPPPSRATALHALPSAKASNPIIVHTPTPSRALHHCARLFAVLTVALLLLVGSLFVLMEGGVGDAQLAKKAQQMLQNAVGDRFVARVDGAALRLADDGRIAIQARGVHIDHAEHGHEIVGAVSVTMALKARPLLSGEIKVSHVEIDGAFVDLVQLDPVLQGDQPPEPFRIDGIPALVEDGLVGLRTTADMMANRATRRVVVKDAVIAGLGSRPADSGDKTVLREIEITTAEISETPDRGLELEADLKFAEQQLRIDAQLRDAVDNGKDLLKGRVDGIQIGELIREFSGNPKRKFRLESDASVSFSAGSGSDGDPTLTADIQLGAGELYMDGVGADMKDGSLHLELDAQRKTLDLTPTVLNIGKSSYRLNGAIIDLDNLPGQSETGLGIDVVVDDATIAPTDSAEPPVKVVMKVLARYVQRERRLYVDDFVVSGAKGTLYSSASVQLSDTSPEISFVANVAKMDTRTLKQLWPYWIAKGARRWVLKNVFGGTIEDGSIRIFIPEGRMAKALPGPLNLDHNQLQIAFNVENARFDVAGDIPPVRDAKGILELRGTRLDLGIETGKSYFPSGRVVEITDGAFAIPATNAYPLMATLDIGVAGDASAVAELVTYQPINALSRTPYKPEDFEGPVSSKLDVTFGLLQTQDPPKPDWKVEVDLGGVSVGPRIDGVKVADAKGKMFVDPSKIVFDTDASLDGITGHLDFTEPLDTSEGQEPNRTAHLIMDNKDRAQLAPQINTFIDGTVDVTANLHSNGRQQITADLTSSRLLLPWIGWSKGKGIQAQATFVLVAKSDSDPEPEGSASRLPENISIEDLVLTGDGFSAKGSLHFDGGELQSADFTQVTLNRDDSFAVQIERQGSGYKIEIKGRSIDMRSSIKEFLSETAGSSGRERQDARIDLNVTADEALGFGGETLTGFKLRYEGKGSNIDVLDLSAKTSRGLPLEAVAKREGSGVSLSLKSQDAGSTARLLDIYDKVEGGTLDAQLYRSGDGPYVGTVRISEFDVVGEERLQSLVSSRPEGGRSLNEAVRRRIDVGHVHFNEASAKVDKGRGYLKLSDGIARGPLVGFAFQGTVYDAATGMDIAGTFMPAYGLNRIFGEIPILGAILGNGRDRGLIGITFRLSGSFEDPKLQINPISVIAPGIFRNIFQFHTGDASSKQRPTVIESSR